MLQRALHPLGRSINENGPAQSILIVSQTCPVAQRTVHPCSAETICPCFVDCAVSSTGGAALGKMLLRNNLKCYFAAFVTFVRARRCYFTQSGIAQCLQVASSGVDRPSDPTFVMSAWGTTHSAHWAASQQGQTGGRAQNHSAWPPYKLPTDCTHGADRSHQASGEPISRSGLALQPFSRTQAFELKNTRGDATSAPTLQSTSSHVPIHTPLKSSSAYNVSQGAFEQSTQQHGGGDDGSAKSDLYHMAHLSFPKTWVHLWDRSPLTTPDTFLSTVRSICSL